MRTVAKANRKTINDEASLRRLSPSIMLTKDLGTFTCRMIVVAEIASGGETIPPSRKPSASVNPGMNALEKKATTQAVIITTGNAKLVITRRHFQNSFQEVCHAASYNNGGRKIKKTSSGSIVICEKKEVKLRASPPVYFDKSFFNELLQLKGDVGARGIIQKYIEDVQLIPFPKGDVDIDTSADYERLSRDNSGLS